MQSHLVDNLCEPLERYLRQAGIYYRIFARQKSIGSIMNKLSQKREDYIRKGKKMQDYVGIRIVFYFQDDVEIFHEKLKMFEGYDSANESNTNTDLDGVAALREQIEQNEALKPLSNMFPLYDKVFMPQRLNIVLKMPFVVANAFHAELPPDLSNQDKQLIDETYEVQLRTVLSEGWHEVEHDLRYKKRNEQWWEYCQEESRQLNGIYATLESSECALSNLIAGLAYKNFKSKEWDAMIRNHFRLRFNESKLSEDFVDYLNNNLDIAKECFKIERGDLIKWIWEIKSTFQLTTDMAFCIANRKKWNIPSIISMEPRPIKLILDRDFPVA